MYVFNTITGLLIGSFKRMHVMMYVNYESACLYMLVNSSTNGDMYA